MAADDDPASPNLRRDGGWSLRSVVSGGEVTAALEKHPVTIEFARRSFSGNAPNHYSGKLRAGPGGRIRVELREITEMGSAPATMKQEGSFLGLLNKITTYAFDGDDLMLSDGTTKNELRFRTVAVEDTANQAESVQPSPAPPQNKARR
jgi:heat shock protein HslJ